LWLSKPGAAIDTQLGPYDVFAAIGVIGNGAAPVSFFFEIVSNMAVGSHFVFSFNDSTLKDPQFESAFDATLDSGGFRLLFKEYGPHFPKRDMGSNVYVLQRK
jgi:hypothetical protein